MKLIGSGNTLKNCRFDDANYAGVSGAVAISGTGNTIQGCTLDNCIRYGFIVQTATSWTIRDCTVLKAQHGISGSSGYDGQWTPSTNGLIENCHISGVIQHGIKLKNMKGVTVRNNVIDLTTNGKTGLVFGGADSATQNAVIENNIFIDSTTKTTIGIEATPDGKKADGTYKWPRRMTGNIIRYNQFTNLNFGIYIKNNNFVVYGNTFQSVSYPIRNYGLNNQIS